MSLPGIEAPWYRLIFAMPTRGESPVSADAPVTPWYAEWFGSDYLDVYAHRDVEEAVRQLDLMERVLRPSPGSRVLDLCCGGGRHSVELARRGYRVVGVDLSGDLLDAAMVHSDRKGVDVEFIRGDMRCAVADGAFDVVVNFFTSFGYFELDAENQRVLSSIRRCLRPGGAWLMDYLNRDHAVRNLVPRDERRIGDLLVRQERHIDSMRDRIEKTITLSRHGGAPRSYRESVRMYTLPEMARMTCDADLTITGTFGDSDGRPFGNYSPRLVLTGTTR